MNDMYISGCDLSVQLLATQYLHQNSSLYSAISPSSAGLSRSPRLPLAHILLHQPVMRNMALRISHHLLGHPVDLGTFVIVHHRVSRPGQSGSNVNHDGQGDQAG